MGMRVGINGFGRIGRNIMRAAMAQADADIEFVAVNDITDPETLAHLFKYDSVLGNLEADVEVEGDGLRVGDAHFKVFSERDPAALPWGELASTSWSNRPASSRSATMPQSTSPPARRR